MENKTIPSLDLVRFAAALMVMWYHLAYASWAEPTRTTAAVANAAVSLPEMAATSNWGWVGVNVFFVLSGFVICLSAAGKSASEFAVGRILRLYPAVWVCAPISLAAWALCGGGELVRRLSASLVLFPLKPWVDGVYWTLGIEMVFYGLIWLLLLFRGFQHVQWLLIGIGLPSGVVWLGDVSGLMPYVRLGRYYELLLLEHGCLFALGGLMFLNFKNGYSPFRCVSSIAFGAASVNGILHQKDPASLTAVVVWALAVAAIASGAELSKRPNKLVAGPWVRLIGLATYPLYLIHNVVGAAVLRWTVGLPKYGALALAIFVVITLAFLLLSPERQVRAVLKGLIGRILLSLSGPRARSSKLN